MAFALISLSVLIGLAMANRLVRGRTVVKLHEHLALAGIVAMAAIAVHGITLLGDRWPDPGAAGLLVPFTMDYEPVFTGLGMVAGYLAALFGLSFYLRRRLGMRRWPTCTASRSSSTSSARSMRSVPAGPRGGVAARAPAREGAPIPFLLLLRVLPDDARSPASRRQAS